MKGTLAILGLLCTAYAAPLFGNEVPLILEETIQMGYPSSFWDVAPMWGGEYYWAVGENRIVHFGSTRDGLLGEIGPLGQSGNLTYLKLFLSPNMEIGILASTSWHVSFPPVSYESAKAWAYSFAGTPALLRSEQFDGRGIDQLSDEAYDYLGIGRAFPIPPPPDVCERIPLDVVYDWEFFHPGYDGPYFSRRGHFTPDFLDSNAVGFPFEYAENFDHTIWGGSEFMFASGTQELHHSNRPTTYTVRSRMYEVSESGWSSIGWLSGAQAKAIVSYGNPRRPLFLTQSGSSYLAISEFGDTLWTDNDGNASTVLVAYALLGENSEQILFARSGRLNIRIAETGELWGSTSGFDGSDMKIIGRYHNETRRLVVRYGSELRIYRFGDPIYTDADDTLPELPGELSLSAYPNPFNPTTIIAFDLPEAARASLNVYDLQGRIVRTLFDEQRSAGHHEIGLDGASLPSGIYFARLVSGDLVRTQKLVLLK